MTFPAPTSLADWLAFLALLATLVFGLVSLVALAWAAWRHTSTEANKQRQSRDVRLQELAKIIYNQGGAFGLGAQILAIDELKRYKKQKAALGRYSDALRRHYTTQNAAKELFEALDELDRTIGRT